MSLNDQNGRPLAAGEEIYRLIPQRPPIVMVDALFEVSETGAVTGLTVLSDNIFVERGNSGDSGSGGDAGLSAMGGRLSESGIIEHVAQSAAVFNGYWAVVHGVEPSLGYIAEIKKFRIEALPPVGSRLRTELKVQNSFGGMMLLSATVLCKAQSEESDPPFGEAGSRTNGMEQDGWQMVAAGQMKLFIDSKD